MAVHTDSRQLTSSAKPESKNSALARKIKELSKRTQAHFGPDQISHIRTAPKKAPPSNHCSCSCGCC